jgi:glycosyltransferase involved in cell wall biosynthesis
MIIGIDISSITYGTGVSNYTLNLVRSLLKNDKINTYKLFYSSLRRPLPPEIKQLSRHHKFKIYHHRLPPTLLSFLWNKLHIFPIEIFIGKCDVFHTSDWTQPPAKHAKTITTIHDLVPFIFPETLHPLIVKTHTLKLKRATQNCHHFICVSKNTQTDLLKIFPQIKPAQTSVIYEAAETKYDQFLKLTPQKQEAEKQKIYRLYDLKKYLLAQGTREPRKNLQRLITAFIKFKNKYPKSTLELAISGKYGWGKDIDHLKHPYIKILGYIPEKDMVALHASALALAYPSTYEGFGLPIIKSLKVGVPVICSNTSSMPEIIGQAGLLVDPTSVDQIANAICKISRYPSLRQKLIKKGLLQAQKFSWDSTAKQTLLVYNQL